MPLILICSSFAPLAVVAFFPFFCRFFADSCPFSVLLRVRVFSRCFSCLCKIIFAFFAFAKSAFAFYGYAKLCKICICILFY